MRYKSRPAAFLSAGPSAEVRNTRSLGSEGEWLGRFRIDEPHELGSNKVPPTSRTDMISKGKPDEIENRSCGARRCYPACANAATAAQGTSGSNGAIASIPGSLVRGHEQGPGLFSIVTGSTSPNANLDSKKGRPDRSKLRGHPNRRPANDGNDHSSRSTEPFRKSIVLSGLDYRSPRCDGGKSRYRLNELPCRESQRHDQA
jgi:hypothetical protein